MNKDIHAEIESLPDETRWALERADGFLDLRMLEQASQELELVPEAHHKSTPYLEVRLREAMEREEWPAAQGLARMLCGRIPNEPAFWVQLAYTTRRAVDIPAARSILEQAMSRFPLVAVIPYNLACYDCCMGNPEKAASLLDRAFQLDAAYRNLACEDADLEPLWDSLEGD